MGNIQKLEENVLLGPKVEFESLAWPQSKIGCLIQYESLNFTINDSSLIMLFCL